MKTFWGLVAAVILILTANVAYNAGEAEQRQFEALCETPGVRCAVEVTPAYVAAHAGQGIEMLPYATYEWRNDDGGLR